MIALDVAKKYLGLHEVKDNKALKEFLHKNSIDGDIAVDPAKTAWCACFVNACLRVVGIRGTGRQNARSFLTFGKLIYDKKKGLGKITDARPGDIIVFERGTGANRLWQGHVTFIDSVKLGGFTCVGGNQSDAVTSHFYARDNTILGIRRGG